MCVCVCVFVSTPAEPARACLVGSSTASVYGHAKGAVTRQRCTATVSLPAARGTRAARCRPCAARVPRPRLTINKERGPGWDGAPDGCECVHPVYVCVCVCMCVCTMCVCVCQYVYTSLYVSTHAKMCMFVQCASVCTAPCVYVCPLVNVCTCVHM